MQYRIMVTTAQFAGDLADLKGFIMKNMATKDDISALNARMDGFSGLLEDSRYRWAVHSDTLTSHDARLRKLESRKS